VSLSPRRELPFAVAVAAPELEPGVLEPAQIVEGAPRVSERVLWASHDGRVIVGVWEITPGVVTDVEADEVFTVLHGRATVEVEDGPTLALGPGVIGALRAGDRTVWRVQETLRKTFQISVSA
jgi:uncharacterized protein